MKTVKIQVGGTPPRTADTITSTPPSRPTVKVTVTARPVVKVAPPPPAAERSTAVICDRTTLPVAEVVNRDHSPFDVYIGRGSPYGNPFTHINSNVPGVIVVPTKGDAIRRYRAWLLGTEHEPTKYGWTPPSRDKVLALRGKRLGCHCKPDDCHGDVLVELIEMDDQQALENAEATLLEDGDAVQFLRWAGSKRDVAAELVKLVLDHLAPGRTYYEPFLGAGAVALALPRGTRMTLGDFCRPLAGVWWWLKRNAGRLAEAIPPAFRNDEETYYQLREQFNTLKFSTDDPLPSALFVWLNHTNYNGIYRENKDGGYNVPWGKRKKIALPSELQLRRVGEHLRTAEIMVGADFAETLRGVGKGDVVFLDPPYDETFSDYNAGGFGPDEQERLAAIALSCAKRGAFVMQTNADTERVRNLYGSSPWRITAVDERRTIAADPGKRAKAACVLITNAP